MKNTPRQTDNPQEQGFAIYLVLGFIVLVSLNLSALSQQLDFLTKRQLSRFTQKNIYLEAHHALQFGFAEMKAEGAAILADETGYSLAAGLSDSNLVSDREVCLTGRGSYTSASAASYLSSRAVTSKNIRWRYFIYDASAGSTPRQFEIYGCAIKGTQNRVVYGLWEYNTSTQAFNLIRAESF